MHFIDAAALTGGSQVITTGTTVKFLSGPLTISLD